MPAEKPKRKIPERKCVGCNEKKEKRELVRIVRTPEGSVEVDSTGKKSGRGAYLCRSTACLKKAIKAKRLQHHLECEIPEDVYRQLEGELSENADKQNG